MKDKERKRERERMIEIECVHENRPKKEKVARVIGCDVQTAGVLSAKGWCVK